MEQHFWGILGESSCLRNANGKRRKVLCVISVNSQKWSRCLFGCPSSMAWSAPRKFMFFRPLFVCSMRQKKKKKRNWKSFGPKDLERPISAADCIPETSCSFMRLCPNGICTGRALSVIMKSQKKRNCSTRPHNILPQKTKKRSHRGGMIRRISSMKKFSEKFCAATKGRTWMIVQTTNLIVSLTIFVLNEKKGNKARAMISGPDDEVLTSSLQCLVS